MIQRILLCALVATLPSCGLYSKLNDAVDRVDLATAKADQALVGIEQGLATMGERGAELASKVAEIRVAVTEADKNGDGRVAGVSEWTELIYQLLAILGIGGYAAATNYKRRANVQAIYSELDSLKQRVSVAAPRQ